MSYANDKIKSYIGDIRDYRCVYDAFSGGDYVFHVVVLNHVPSCEFYPRVGLSKCF